MKCISFFSEDATKMICLFFFTVLAVSTRVRISSAFTLRPLSKHNIHYSTNIIKSTLLKSSTSNDDEFVMPSSQTLISDLDPSQRGIGVGIDLGTTNSAISIITDENIPQIINVDDKATMPSIVTLYPITTDNEEENKINLEILVGNPCLIHEEENTNSNAYTYRHVKRIIGMGTTTAAGSADVVPHLIRTASQRRKGRQQRKKNQNKNNGAMSMEAMLREAREFPAQLKLPSITTLDSNNHDDDDMKSTMTTTNPEYISSLILKKLFQTVEDTTGEVITRAVIGVPAYFNDVQRDATIKAATLASNIPKERIKLLREPEAAALAYGIGKQQINRGDEDELVLVFDLGGGTFDVSILEVGGGIYEVVGTGGNTMLGGSDFDAKIAQWLSKKCVVFDCGKNWWKEGGDVADVMVMVAEQIRIALSNSREIVLRFPLFREGWMALKDSDNEGRDVIVSTKGKSKEYDDIDEKGVRDNTHVTCKMTRKTMEELCADEFLALLRPVREVALLAGAMLPGDASPSAVEAVIQMEEEMELEGGSSLGFDSFYDEESGNAKNDDNDDDVNEEMLLQLKEYDLKEQKKKQQKGRKRARNTQKNQRKFRAEKRKADEEARFKTAQSANTKGGNTKVMDGINGRPISQVVLVGGATRMPAIGRLLAAVTGVVPQKTVNPDEAVALGCAVQVGILDGINTDLQVLTPIEAAMMRAMAKKQGLDVAGDFDNDDDDFDAEFGDFEEFGEEVEYF